MRLAIMQPYLFPYLGYFRLISSVDTFVFYDDVSYIKNGWINRNRLVISGAPKWITFPVAGAGMNAEIRDVRVSSDSQWRRKILASVTQSYAGTAGFEVAIRLLRDVVLHGSVGIGELAKLSIQTCSRALGLQTEFIPSSSAFPNRSLRGMDRILDICNRLGATEYVNLPGGRMLYDPESFDAAGLRLKFIPPVAWEYSQFSESFIPNLSILDALMFNRPETVASHVCEWRPR